MRNVATAITISFVVSSSVCVQGTVLLDEEFDGDLSEWSILDTNSQPTLQPWGPADVKIVEETLSHRTTGDVQLNPMPSIFETGTIFSLLDRSAVDDRFANGFFRATVRANTESIASLFMRGDTTTFSGYQFRGNGSLGEFQIARFVNAGGTTLLGQLNMADDPAFSVGDNWIIEAGAINDRLSMKVWREGESEPAEPQLVVFDDLLSDGQIALGSSVSPAQLSLPTRVDVTYDDILFRAVPEPAANGLLFLGIPVAVLIRRRPVRHS